MARNGLIRVWWWKFLQGKFVNSRLKACKMDSPTPCALISGIILRTPVSRASDDATFNTFWPVSRITLMITDEAFYCTNLYPSSIRTDKPNYPWKTLIRAQPGIRYDSNKEFITAKLCFQNKCSPFWRQWPRMRATHGAVWTNCGSQGSPGIGYRGSGGSLSVQNICFGVRADGWSSKKDKTRTPNLCQLSLALILYEGGLVDTEEMGQAGCTSATKCSSDFDLWAKSLNAGSLASKFCFGKEWRSIQITGIKSLSPRAAILQ